MRSFDQPILAMHAEHPLSFTSPFSSNPHTPSTWPPFTPLKSAPSAAGRKRSRDEAADNLLAEDEYFPIQALQPPVENEEEWVYGEGMTLIKPSRGGIAIEASSQTGTWAEEKAEAEKAQAQAALSSSPERPILRAAKSQRLNFSTSSIAEEVMQNGTLMTPSAPSPERGYTEPTIDDFTRHLGIGWSLISTDDHIQAAARGWTKFIENHFPITNAKIALQSRGLSSYLVEASEGYFLFGEDLKQGRLVSINLETVWANLSGAVPIFDGETTMNAATTPTANIPMSNGELFTAAAAIPGVPSTSIDTPMGAESTMAEANIDQPNSVINRAQQANPQISQAVEVEMDMS